MKYKRLTTENPQSNVESMLNMVMAIDNKVFLRNVYGEDISLIDYCKAEYRRLYNEDIDVSVEEFGEYMDDYSLLSMFYWITVGYAELRLRLSQYEDSGLSPNEVKEQQQKNKLAYDFISSQIKDFESQPFDEKGKHHLYIDKEYIREAKKALLDLGWIKS